MKQVLTIQGIPMNLNKYRNAHFHVLSSEKRKWERIVQIESKKQKIFPMEKAIVTLIFHFNNKRKRDADNYALCAKFLLDGLVKAKIFIDDNFDIVEELRVKRGANHKEPYIEVVLEHVS
jgi:Holliday junction resolvase RusA-like endonuclease